jgi:hypothetical protein
VSNFKDLTQAMKRRMGEPARAVSLRGEIGNRVRLLANEPIRLEGFEGLDRTAPEPTPAVLISALEAAAELEFATIPIYLLALWSVIDQDDPVARSIRAIVHEEMLHLSLVNKFLVAVGGTPKMTGERAPVYPGRLPGGVHPELWVTLDGLTNGSLDTFLELERPVWRVAIEGAPGQGNVTAEDRTIGEFYDAILEMARDLELEYRTERQIAGPLAPMIITGRKDVEKAVELIQRQGEGAKGLPFEEGTKDLAHYYRFMEIKLERRLIWAYGKLHPGDPLERPSVYPVAPPPEGGYGLAYPKRIQELSGEFNRCYSTVLASLESAWGDGGHGAFLQGMEQMFRLKEIAREMMRTPGPDGRGHAPEFRYVK